MKIAVIGAGAMGSLFGAKLALAGNQVTMIDVVPEVLKAVQDKGLILEENGETHSIPLTACRGEELKDPVELAILFTKTLYSRGALESARSFIGENTYVMSLQNGLGNVELISEYVDPSKIIAGATNYASDLKGPGHIAATGAGYIKIMSADGKRNPGLEAVQEQLVKAGMNSEITEDVFVTIWEKCGFNAAINSMTAICHVPCGGVGMVEEGQDLAYKIAEETAKVANAFGVNASAQAMIASLKNTMFVAHRDHFTSMAQDVQRKRKTEVSFINGGIVKKAREAGIQVPYTEAVFDLLRIIEETYSMQE